MSRANYVFTSESVSEGHPDKVCDRISDAVVDLYLAADPYARVAIETLVTTNRIVMAGEVRGPESVTPELIEQAARRTEGIAAEPAPYVRQTALSDFYVEYRLVAYTAFDDPAKRMDVLSCLHGTIQVVFNEHGVQIMSPHYLADPAEPQVVPKERWFAPPAKPPGKER